MGSANCVGDELSMRLQHAIEVIESSLHVCDFIEPGNASPFLNQFMHLYGPAKEKDAIVEDILSRFFFGWNEELLSRYLELFVPALFTHSKVVKRFVELYDCYDNLVSDHNTDLAKSMIDELRTMINPVNDLQLDEQQLSAIATDVRTRLVIAGAGTGKTTTIVGLVKYLLLSKKAASDEILLLSFTNASVDDLYDKIIKESNEKIQVRTFHSFANGIIAKTDHCHPNVFDKNGLHEFINSKLSFLMKDENYQKLVSSFFLFDDMEHGEEQSADQLSLEQFLKSHPQDTFKGERVKSQGEAVIANYLAMNGIGYVYEDDYQFDTSNSDYRQYHPDFHLSGTNIYIEYFGIDRNGDVAKSQLKRDPCASIKYGEAMEWKRMVHRKNGTILIELFSYNYWEGKLIDELHAALKKNNVSFNPIPSSVLLEKIMDDRRKVALRNLISSAIMLIKGFGRAWDDVYPHSEYGLWEGELARLEKIIRPIYDAYQMMLLDTHKIDYEDMMNIAIDRVRNGLFIHRFKYVIVDEYQDLSRSRFNLLKALRESNDYRLFCVGDDWQSIYRFNGCDVGYILDFEKYWGPSAICKIESTYRFSGNLLKKSSAFVSKDPRLYRKELIGKSGAESNIVPIV